MRTRTGALIITLAAAALFIAPASHAFDTFPHFDLIKNELKAQGFSDCAVKIAQVGNWYVDYYTSTGVGDHGRANALHFDNLFTAADEGAHFDWLEEVYKKKIGMITSNMEPWQQPFGDECDCLSLLLTMGMGLHAIQDFYAHSNWRNVDWKAKGYPNPPTWDDVKPEDRNSAKDADGNGIYSGSYGRDAPAGHKTHDHLNADDSGRPGHFDAMVMARRATAQWTAKFQEWIGPECWEKLMNCCPDDQKKAIDSEWDWAKRLSLATGHWDAEKMGAEVLPAGVGYKTTEDTLLNRRWKQIINQLFQTAHEGSAEHAMAEPQFPDGLAFAAVTFQSGEQFTLCNAIQDQAASVTLMDTNEIQTVPPTKSITLPLAHDVLYSSPKLGNIAIYAERTRMLMDRQMPGSSSPHLDALRIGETDIEKLPLQSGVLPALAVIGSMPPDSQLKLSTTDKDGKKQDTLGHPICKIGSADWIREMVVRFPLLPLNLKAAELLLTGPDGNTLAKKEVPVSEVGIEVKIDPEVGTRGSRAKMVIDMTAYLAALENSRWGFKPGSHVFKVDYSRSGGSVGPAEMTIPPGQTRVEAPFTRGYILGVFPIGFRLTDRTLLLKPDETGFRQAYDADKVNNQEESWNEYWARVRRFYEGGGGWDDQIRGLVSGKPDDLGLKIAEKAGLLGQKLASEWAKYPGIGKINNADMRNWSKKLDDARLSDAGDGDKIGKALDDIGKEADKKLAK